MTTVVLLHRRAGIVLGLSLLASSGCPMDDDGESAADTDAPETSTSSTEGSTSSSSAGSETTTSSAATGSSSMATSAGETGPTTGDDDSGSTTDDSGSTTESPATISGTVSRLEAAAPAPEGDGIGTLYVAALSDCLLTAPIVGAAIVEGADVSSPDLKVPYAIELQGSGVVHLALFLDDDGNADPMAPTPGPGDLVYATGDGPDGVLSCIEVDPNEGDTDAVDLVLTATVPSG